LTIKPPQSTCISFIQRETAKVKLFKQKREKAKKERKTKMDDARVFFFVMNHQYYIRDGQGE